MSTLPTRSDSVVVPRAVVNEAIEALRKTSAHMIAFPDDTPFSDAPEQTRWTRFQKPLAERCSKARHALERAARS